MSNNDQLLQQLIQNQAALVQQVANLTANMANVAAPQVSVTVPDTRVIDKPAPFKGQLSDARRFLAQFELWAKSHRAPLNDPISSARSDRDWIRAALFLMEDNASNWALRYIHELNDYAAGKANAVFPFASRWDDFITEFKLRWIQGDEQTEARRMLDACKPKTAVGGIGEYASAFQEVSPRTGYSDADLMVRFYDRLPAAVKEKVLGLDFMAGKATTLQELVTRAIRADELLIKIRADTAAPFWRRNYAAPPTPARPERDPMAMDVDATRTASGRTREDFTRAMIGRCYGCGSSNHQKRDGGHEREVCAFCRRQGHKEAVCQDRFLGLDRNRGLQAPGRRVAAAVVQEAPFSLFGPEAPTVPTTPVPPAPAPSTSIAATSNQMATMEELQAMLRDQQELIKRYEARGQGF